MMKKILLTLITFSLVFIFSCNKPEEKLPTTVLEGSWEMTSYDFAFFQHEEYNANDIVWNFKKLKLEIIYNIEQDSIKVGYIGAGFYDIKVFKHEKYSDLDVLLFNDIEYIFSINDDILVMDQSFGSESISREFKRIE